MTKTIKDLFDRGADGYDRQRKQLIPCFDDFYGTATEFVTCAQDAPRILDLGAGTGLFTGMVREKFPNAELTLIDFSEPMLEGARFRFRDVPNVRYIVADYANYDFSVEQPYDAIVSSLSIHHLEHEDKRRLFSKIVGALAEGGVFVNADQTRGCSEETDRLFYDRWLEDVRRSGLSEENVAASVERRKADITATPTEQMCWMEEAGFAIVDCVYKNLGFAVFYGRKAT